jgi:RNA polymerase sigma-B factor
MSTATDTVVALSSWPQWQSRSRTPMVSTSDASNLDAGLAHPGGLLVRLGELPPGDARRVEVRARAIEGYLPLAVYLARRFSGRGEPLVDLTQVAAIGLIRAVDRYDASRGVPFAGYAIPTILGELKRHFRDTAWTVRVPRRLQELKPQLSTATEELAHALHRPPTMAELAARLGVGRDEVLAAQRCSTAYRPVSLDQPRPDWQGGRLIDLLGSPDTEIETVGRREVLRQRLAELPDRERRIIALRFVAEMTQTQIAADLGVSQMQVSRLLARCLARLRDALLADADNPAAAVGILRQPSLAA